MFGLTKYGIDTILIILIICFLCIIFSLYYFDNILIKLLISIIFIDFVIFTLFFFRDPERKTPNIENAIISPADGKICLIKEVEKDKYLNNNGIQVSIFMSPLNVHVNRAPIDGEVIFKKYIPGKFHVAYVDKASELNEQTVVIFDNGKYKILMKQIAGYIARRIVNTLEVGSKVKKGEKLGMIKFGSRVDLILPKNAKLNVKLNDVVLAGETIIASID